MPHITKYSEKMKCVRSRMKEIWSEDLKYKYVIPEGEPAKVVVVPEKFYGIIQTLPSHYSDYTAGDKQTLFSLIEEIIDNTMKSNWTNGDFFNEFVDIKEVPYGRYNSDSDYRGS